VSTGQETGKQHTWLRLTRSL